MKTRKMLAILMALVMLSIILASCSNKPIPPALGDNSSASSSQVPADSKTSEPAESGGDTGSIRFSGIWNETAVGDGKALREIADEYIAMNPDFDYSYEFFVQNDMSEYLSVLAASNDLPDIFACEPNTLVKPYSDAGLLMEYDEVFAGVGLKVEDYIKGGAVKCGTINIPDGKHWVTPFTNNAEGFWLNTNVLTKAGIEVPEDWYWEDFYAICNKLLAAGIQPIAQGFDSKWPATRYLMFNSSRELGVKAHMDAAWNKIEFTQPEFIAGGKMLQDMYKKGYFGDEGCLALNMSDAELMAVNGTAAMEYDGSWAIATFLEVDPESYNYMKLMPIPYSRNSKIPLEEQKVTYNLNVGAGFCFTKDNFAKGESKGYIKYLFESIGDKHAEAGSTSAYFVQHPDKIESKLNPLHDQVSAIIEKTQFVSQWFEAQMGPEATDLAMTNVIPLVTSEMSSEEYFKILQDAAIRQAEAAK